MSFRLWYLIEVTRLLGDEAVCTRIERGAGNPWESCPKSLTKIRQLGQSGQADLSQAMQRELWLVGVLNRLIVPAGRESHRWL